MYYVWVQIKYSHRNIASEITLFQSYRPQCFSITHQATVRDLTDIRSNLEFSISSTVTGWWSQGSNHRPSFNSSGIYYSLGRETHYTNKSETHRGWTAVSQHFQGWLTLTGTISLKKLPHHPKLRWQTIHNATRCKRTYLHSKIISDLNNMSNCLVLNCRFFKQKFLKQYPLIFGLLRCI